MTSRPSVERQFRFHCSCGAITVTGERTVTCTGCGETLAIRRGRRRRQQPDSVSYYGRTIPVRRLDPHRQHPRGTFFARFSAYLERVLASHETTIRVRRVEKRADRLNTAPNVGGEGTKHNLQQEWLQHSLHKELSKPALLEGAHVKVKALRPDGTPHPHAGKTGTITRFENTHTAGPPSAMVRVDSGIEPQGYICVSLPSLELFTS